MMIKNKFILSGICLISAAFILIFYNFYESKAALNNIDSELRILNEQFQFNKEIESNPLYIHFPNMEMPICEIDGHKYIGVLEIPSLELQLPILNSSDDVSLKIAPGRYKGSIYLDNMIIAGHNYPDFFGNLNKLNIDDTIIFTDVDSNIFTFVVEDFEMLKGTDIERMEQGEWDLTLFTCDFYARNRFTVRCTHID